MLGLVVMSDSVSRRGSKGGAPGARSLIFGREKMFNILIIY